MVENLSLIKFEQPVHRQCYITSPVNKALLNNTMRNIKIYFLERSGENKLHSVECQSPDPYLRSIERQTSSRVHILTAWLRFFEMSLGVATLIWNKWLSFLFDMSSEINALGARWRSGFGWTCRTKRIASPNPTTPLMSDHFTIHHHMKSEDYD